MHFLVLRILALLSQTGLLDRKRSKILQIQQLIQDHDLAEAAANP